MQIQLWKLDCTRRYSNSGPFCLRGQCSTEWAKGDSLQPSQRLVRTNTCNIFPLHEESRPRDWMYSCTFASLTRNIFATHRNTESTLEHNCHICKYNCEKLYCTGRDSNSVPLVYEASALPNELKGIPSSRVSMKWLVRTNTCDSHMYTWNLAFESLRFIRFVHSFLVRPLLFWWYVCFWLPMDIVLYMEWFLTVDIWCFDVEISDFPATKGLTNNWRIWFYKYSSGEIQSVRFIDKVAWMIEIISPYRVLLSRKYMCELSRTQIVINNLVDIILVYCNS